MMASEKADLDRVKVIFEQALGVAEVGREAFVRDQEQLLTDARSYLDTSRAKRAAIILTPER